MLYKDYDLDILSVWRTRTTLLLLQNKQHHILMKEFKCFVSNECGVADWPDSSAVSQWLCANAKVCKLQKNRLCGGERSRRKRRGQGRKKGEEKRPNWDERQTETLCSSVTKPSASIVRESCAQSQFKTQINCGYITNPGLRRQWCWVSRLGWL